MNKTIKLFEQMAGVGLFAAVLTVSGAGKAGNLVANPDFSATFPNNYFPNAVVSDWTVHNNGIVFIYGPGGADMTGAPPQDTTSKDLTYLWGPNNPGSPTNPTTDKGKCSPLALSCYSNNNLPSTSPFDPGTNYLASD